MTIVAIKEKTGKQAFAPAAVDWVDVARRLGADFAARSAAFDAEDRFVEDNYAALKASGLVSAGVPAELGGAGASAAQMAEVLRELAHHCPSTALAFAMHTHQVMMNAWRWRHAGAPVDGLLKRVVAERIVLLSSGGSDWLDSAGTATRVEGGYRIDARKGFTSGAAAGDLLLTSAVFDDPQAGPTVLHFGVPMKSDAVRIEPTWKAMGMRGTGSHDVVISGFFLADGAVGGRRPKGRWHPLFHIVCMLALPLIYNVYVGVAQAARDLALRQAAARRTDAHLLQLVGAMEIEVKAAELALAEMMAAAASDAPGPETTRRVLVARSLVARAALEAVELAMQAAGGAAFYRSMGLERLFRDVQGARYHPLPDGPAREFTARVALGLDIDGA